MTDLLMALVSHVGSMEVLWFKRLHVRVLALPVEPHFDRYETWPYVSAYVSTLYQLASLGYTDLVKARAYHKVCLLICSEPVF